MDLGRLIGSSQTSRPALSAPPSDLALGSEPAPRNEPTLSSEPGNEQKPPRRRWLLLLLLVAVTAAGWRVAQIEGLVRSIRVSGPSMSPTLWGPHRQATCPACGFGYRIHASMAPSGRSLRCFGCGHLGIEISTDVQPGDRVWIDRAAYLGSSPQRDDLVAIRTPGGGIQVKRVVGLPGEVVRISPEGGLIVGARPIEMSPEQSWQRSVVVYDDRYRGPTGSRWQRMNSGWIVYRHVDIYSPSGETVPGKGARIRDDDPANASLRRQTYPVEDLQLAVSLRAADPCVLEVRFAEAGGAIAASIDVAVGEQTVRVSKIGPAVWLLPTDGSPRRVDREWAASETPEPAVTPARPVALRLRPKGLSGEEPVGKSQVGEDPLGDDPLGGERGLAEGELPEVDRLWLGRSVRFDPPHADAEQWFSGVPVAADHYLVFGDNPPASEDSRTAPEGVPRHRIVGRVAPWPR